MPRILLVDDDIAEISAVKRALLRAGHQAVLATNASDALAAIALEIPRLAVISATCDSGEGLALARRLRDDPRTVNLAVILLGESPDAPLSTTQLSRPIDPAQLAEALQAAFGTAASVLPKPLAKTRLSALSVGSLSPKAVEPNRASEEAERRAAADALRQRAEELRRGAAARQKAAPEGTGTDSHAEIEVRPLVEGSPSGVEQRREEQPAPQGEEALRVALRAEAEKMAAEELLVLAREEAGQEAEEQLAASVEEDLRRARIEEELSRLVEEAEEDERHRAGEERAQGEDIAAIARAAEEGARRQAEEEARRRAEAEAEAAALAAEEARHAEEEAQARAKEEARRQAEQEARRRVEEEARRRAEAEAAARAAAEEARHAEEEAQARAEEEARRRAEEKARRRAETEAAARAATEKARHAEEEAQARAEEEARRHAEAEAEAAARAAAAEARRRAEAEVRRQAEEEARRRIEAAVAARAVAEEARHRAEAEAAARAAAEEARWRAQMEALARAEEEARRQAEEEEEEARRAEEAARRDLAERTAARAAQEEEARRRVKALATERKPRAPHPRPPEPPPPPRSAAPTPARPEPLEPALEKEQPPLPPAELAAGNLADLPMPRLLALAASGRVTGRLDYGGDVPRSIYLEEGRVVGATSGAPHERVDEVALRLGLVTREQHRLAGAGTTGLSSRRAAMLLLDRGWLKPTELTSLVRRRTEEVLFALFGETRAPFRYAAAGVPSDERIALDRGTLALAVEGVRRKWLAPLLDTLLGGPGSLLAPAPQPPTSAELGLTAGEQRVLELADGLRTLDEILADSPLEDLRARQTLAALVMVGALMVRFHAGARATEEVPSIDLARVREKLDQVRRADYFAILGLARQCTPYEIREAAERLGGEFDSARFTGVEEPGLAEKLAEIRQVVAEALEVLSDDALRGEYLAALGDEVA